MRAIESIIVTPKNGAPLHLLIRECLELAIKEWVTVDLLFNGKQYSINPDDLIDFTEKKSERWKIA